MSGGVDRGGDYGMQQHGPVHPSRRHARTPGTVSGSDDEIGTTLREVMRARKWSVSAMARELDVSRPQLSAALWGRRAARYGYWLAIGRVLGLSTEETQARLIQVGAPRGLNTFYEARVDPDD